MNTQSKSAQNPGKNQPKTLADIHQAFANLCYSYGMLGRNISVERNNESLEAIIIDCETLIAVSMALRLQNNGGAK